MLRAPFFSFVLVCSACLRTGDGAEARAFSDDFSDEDLDARYNVQGGSWRAVNGALNTLGDKNLPLWLDAPLSKNVQIDLTASSASTDVDIKVEIFGDGVRHESGYIVYLGGWKNTLAGIARLDEHEKGRVAKRGRWEQGKRYAITVRRTDGKTIELLVDGQLLAKYEDKDPLYGVRNNRFAFSGWESEVTFDDLVIRPLPD